jgi:hypothetical protein
MINTKLYLFVQSVEVMGLDLYEKNAPIVTGRNINYFFFMSAGLRKICLQSYYYIDFNQYIHDTTAANVAVGNC